MKDFNTKVATKDEIEMLGDEFKANYANYEDLKDLYKKVVPPLKSMEK